ATGDRIQAEGNSFEVDLHHTHALAAGQRDQVGHVVGPVGGVGILVGLGYHAIGADVSGRRIAEHRRVQVLVADDHPVGHDHVVLVGRARRVVHGVSGDDYHAIAGIAAGDIAAVPL